MYFIRKVKLEEKIEGFIVWLLSVDVVFGEVYCCFGFVVLLLRMCLMEFIVIWSLWWLNVLCVSVDVFIGIIGCVLGVDIIGDVFGEICGDIFEEICRIKV